MVWNKSDLANLKDLQTGLFHYHLRLEMNITPPITVRINSPNAINPKIELSEKA